MPLKIEVSLQGIGVGVHTTRWTPVIHNLHIILGRESKVNHYFLYWHFYHQCHILFTDKAHNPPASDISGTIWKMDQV